MARVLLNGGSIAPAKADVVTAVHLEKHYEHTIEEKNEMISQKSWYVEQLELKLRESQG